MLSGLPGAYFSEAVLVFALRATCPVHLNRIILILLGRGMQIGELLKYNLLLCNHSVARILKAENAVMSGWPELQGW